MVGPTAFANEYEFEFAKELMQYENVGRGPATDLLSISLSPNDILGHQVGPDSPEMRQMALDLDRELADFFGFRRTSDRPGQCVDRALGRPRRFLAARRGEEVAHSGGESRRRETRSSKSTVRSAQNFLPAIPPPM